MMTVAGAFESSSRILAIEPTYGSSFEPLGTR